MLAYWWAKRRCVYAWRMDPSNRGASFACDEEPTKPGGPARKASLEEKIADLQKQIVVLQHIVEHLRSSVADLESP